MVFIWLRVNIKSWCSATEKYNVELFRKTAVEVPSGEWFRFPLMVPLMCLPNIVELDICLAAYLILSPKSNLEQHDELVVSSNECFRLNAALTRQEKEVFPHRIAVSVDMSTYHTQI